MDRRTLLAGAAAVGASALTGALPGRPAAASAGTGGRLWRTGIAGLHDAMAARVARRELAGIVYAVERRGRLHVDTIGTLSLDGGEPMRRDTPFRIASLTKPIIAVATMMLVEDGRLALDEPVDRLLPELADRRVLTRIDGPLDQTVPAARPITVEDLLTFRMGHGMIFEPSFQPPYPVITAAKELRLVMDQPDPRTTLGPDEWIRRFGTLPLMWQPGQRWQYNTGALVLGVLIARAAGQALETILQRRVFRPLGMRHTGFSLPRADASRLPGLYLGNPGTGQLELQASSPPDEWTRPPAFPSGASGLASTIDDYLAFSRFLRNGGVHRSRRLLSARSIRALTTNHLTPRQLADAGPVLLAGRGWGYGMAVSVTPDAVSAPGRYGWEGGYGTCWFNDPHRDLTAIALTQTVDFIFNGASDEFQRLAAAAAS
ncbi:serine hydrolase domain-containing protein [Phytohabitans aurantiacus]|uniref:Serine hydrolase n=1 Tax=Phytohabitans aurantiacus TaxID=3016789 RepID=A0ABQ5QY15_9ACTN|nr:serine hydrolase domain-containing protein [Phytohabitans aurantiacus]GLH98594.1 serine hydrolase [Phytohabitans aurantiacus]